MNHPASKKDSPIVHDMDSRSSRRCCKCTATTILIWVLIIAVFVGFGWDELAVVWTIKVDDVDAKQQLESSSSSSQVVETVGVIHANTNDTQKKNESALSSWTPPPLVVVAENQTVAPPPTLTPPSAEGISSANNTVLPGDSATTNNNTTDSEGVQDVPLNHTPEQSNEENNNNSNNNNNNNTDITVDDSNNNTLFDAAMNTTKNTTATTTTNNTDTDLTSAGNETTNSSIVMEHVVNSNISSPEQDQPSLETEKQVELPVKNDADREVFNTDQTAMFWNGGKSMCDKMVEWNNGCALGNATCQAQLTRPTPLFNFTVDCKWLKTQEGLGQGNWITAFYVARMATALGQADMQFQCSTGVADPYSNLLFPWFEGYFKAPAIIDPWPFSKTGVTPSAAMACPGKYPGLRVDAFTNQVMDDMQRMAVKIVGTRGDYRHKDVPPDQPPLVPNVELDDIAIHFRCGDVLGGAKRGDFGMIKFSAYKQYIDRQYKTLGIHTQPFEKDLNRGKDKGKTDQCRLVVEKLVDYLQEFLPQTTITIRNSANDTLPLTYARLVMAKQSFTTLSSFGIWPILGTFGDGYFQKGNRGVNPFNTKLPEYNYSNLHMMEAPFMATGSFRGMTMNETLDWFVSD